MLKSLLHIALAFYLLAITAGIAVNKHYCGDYVVSTSLFLKAKSCGEMDNQMEKNCCHDESSFFQLGSDFTYSPSLQFVAALDFNIVIPQFTFLQDIFTLDQQSHTKNQIAYSPPLLATDIPVEVQSFLI